MANKTINNIQGHWILAKMGKKVLRPGGVALTRQLIDSLNISREDTVVEFAPGLGFTARLALAKHPKSYTGIELNQEAAKLARQSIADLGEEANPTIVVANASDTALAAGAYSRVYGEAMLTMQAENTKHNIIAEAHRILKTGGLYGIHELGLAPDELHEDTKSHIQKTLQQVIKVNARPLTVAEWSALLTSEGFEVVRSSTNPMHLLEPMRLVADEGVLGTLKIAFNVLTHPAERKRIFAMHRVFRRYNEHLRAVCVVARKV